MKDMKEPEVQFGIGPQKLLQGMLGQGAKTALIIDALKQCGHYRLKRIRKKSGGLRELHVPPAELKQLQKIILKRFLCRFQGKISFFCHGFVPGRSIITNAKQHQANKWKQVIRLDLKDAFPSVKAETIRAILRKLILPEVSDYADQYRARKKYPKRWYKNIYHKHPIFPTRRVRWFRRLIVNNPYSNLALDIAERFIDLLVSLMTYQGAIPQGAPTSPFLLNLVISDLGIPADIFRELNDQGYEHELTIYADDLVISTQKELPGETVSRITAIIEASGIFKVNQKKTVRFNRRQIAPLITGLRVIKSYDQTGHRQRDKITVPKQKILAIRSLIHKATQEPSEDRDKRVAGYIAFLKGVYVPGGYGQTSTRHLPPAIWKPYEKYLEVKKF